MMHLLKHSYGAWQISAKALVSITLSLDGRSSSLQIINAFILQQMGLEGIKLVQPTYDGLPG